MTTKDTDAVKPQPRFGPTVARTADWTEGIFDRGGETVRYKRIVPGRDGNRRRNIASAKLKTAAFAPRARARTASAISVKPGDLLNVRNAYRRSFNIGLWSSKSSVYARSEQRELVVPLAIDVVGRAIL